MQIRVSTMELNWFEFLRRMKCITSWNNSDNWAWRSVRLAKFSNLNFGPVICFLVHLNKRIHTQVHRRLKPIYRYMRENRFYFHNFFSHLKCFHSGNVAMYITCYWQNNINKRKGSEMHLRSRGHSNWLYCVSIIQFLVNFVKIPLI